MLAVASLNAFLIASFCEECFKYIIISRVVRDERAEDCWHRYPHRPYGTILCGCAAGARGPLSVHLCSSSSRPPLCLPAALGFATIENILYCWADLAVQVAHPADTLPARGSSFLTLAGGGCAFRRRCCVRFWRCQDTALEVSLSPWV